MKREDGFYWVRETGNILLTGNQPLVARWEDELWYVSCQGEQNTFTDGNFEVLSEKLDPPAARSPFAVIADMAAKQMAETIREDHLRKKIFGNSDDGKRVTPESIREEKLYERWSAENRDREKQSKVTVHVKLATSSAYGQTDQRRLSERTNVYPGGALEFETYFSVSVRDDHDGGSVWYVDEDYIEEQSEAEELAVKTSEKRDNGLARVSKVCPEVVAEFFKGKPRVGN